MDSGVKDETDDTPVLKNSGANYEGNDAPAYALQQESSHKTYLGFNEMHFFCIHLCVDITIY
jgi:hypothetical protein